MPIKFKRKVQDNNGSLQVNIPVEIADELDIQKGDTIVITLQDQAFLCRKMD